MLQEHAFKALIDVIPFAIGSLCFVSHRGATLWRALRDEPNVERWRAIFLTQFVNLLAGATASFAPLLLSHLLCRVGSRMIVCGVVWCGVAPTETDRQTFRSHCS